MNQPNHTILIRTVTLLAFILGGCETGNTDAVSPPVPDAGAELDLSTPTSDAVIEPDSNQPEMPVDLDEGEPQPYQYPSSLDAPTTPPYEIMDCAASKLSRVRGWVVDRIGRPVVGARAQLCVTTTNGTLVCLMPAQSNSDGTYTIEVPERESCAQSAVLRVIKTGTTRATMYCELDLNLASSTGEIILREPSVVFATVGATEKPPYEPATSMRDVVFPSGLTMSVVPDDLFGVEPESDYAALSTRHVLPSERGLCFFDEDTRPDHLFAFAPEAAVLGMGAGLSFENRFGYSANQELEVWLLGGLDCTLDGEHIKEGRWASVATALVNETGDKIQTELRLPCLTWIGLKAIN